MKITLENFGIIEKFEFDTENNFTFIIGANNTGKSYAMTAVYLIIKNLPYLIEDFDGLIDLLSDYSSNLDFSHENLLEDFIKNETTSYFEDSSFIEHLDFSFENSFDSINNLQNKLTDNSLKITLITNGITFTIKIKEKYLYFDKINISKSVIDKISTIEEYFEHIQNHSEFKNLKNIYYLPASRSGIYQSMNSFGQIFAELSQKRSDISYDIKIHAMSVPISDYYINLVTIKDDKNKDRNLIELKNIKSSSYNL